MLDDYSQWLDNFIQNGFDKIEGWVDSRIFKILKIINKIQQKLDVKGGALEIGVHHGRFFIPINGMVEPKEALSVAIDLFEDQFLNIDCSGRGDLSKFKENLSLFDRHGGKNVIIIKGDSTRLTPERILSKVSTPFKIISIDGGHTVEHTINDLHLASVVVSEKGVIFVDDILNPLWIGVCEGVIEFLKRRPTIWPVFIAYNKCILVPMSVHHIYLQEFQNYIDSLKKIKLCGYELFTPFD
ncbi:MAG: class I SAM-dependent methyltransferase [Thermodesulfovibrio sp.]